MHAKAEHSGKTALILEGGSFRGQFTAGVLDVMLEHGIEVPVCYGVSAGALNGLNFKSRQIGRVNRVNLAFCNDRRYIGTKSLTATGSLIGYDFMLNDVQDRLDPFDNDAFLANPMRLFATMTDILFGTPSYLEVKNAVLDIDILRATTSLPLITQPVSIDGHLYLDGGVADSVPIEHALEDEEAIAVPSSCLRSTAATRRNPMSSWLPHELAIASIPTCSRPSRRATSAITSSASTSGTTNATGGRW